MAREVVERRRRERSAAQVALVVAWRAVPRQAWRTIGECAWREAVVIRWWWWSRRKVRVIDGKSWQPQEGVAWFEPHLSSLALPSRGCKISMSSGRLLAPPPMVLVLLGWKNEPDRESRRVELEGRE